MPSPADHGCDLRGDPGAGVLGHQAQGHPHGPEPLGGHGGANLLTTLERAALLNTLKESTIYLHNALVICFLCEQRKG